MNIAADLALSQAIGALKRIGRKPWPGDHKRAREFKQKIGGIKVVNVRTEEGNNPLWTPPWALSEYNPCDCSKCIALRTVAELKEQYAADLAAS